MPSFDRLFKEHFESMLVSLSKRLIGIDLSQATLKQLDTQLPRTLSREPDFLRIVELDTGASFILHIEFQTTNHDDMLYRMLEYHALLVSKQKLPVKQVVLYFGKNPVTMQNYLAEQLQFSGYELLALNQWNPESLLQSSIPEEIILAILADYPPEQAKEVIQRILSRLDSIHLKPDLLKKYLFHLTTLARLRKLEDITTNEVHAMPIEYDIETDGLYLKGLEVGRNEGIEKGKQEGLEKGRNEGLEKGRNEGKQKAIEALLLRGQLSEQDIADTLEVSLEYVMQIKRSVNKL